MITIVGSCPLCDQETVTELPEYSVDELSNPAVRAIVQRVIESMEQEHMDSHVDEIIEAANDGPG